MHAKLQLALVVVLLVFSLATFSVFAEGSRPGHMLGFSAPTFGTVHYNDRGALKSITGFNIGLGYSARYFTSDDGLRPNRFNGYWGWGTVLLILPYFEFGVSYPFEIAGGSQYFVIDLGLLYIVPYIQFSIYF